ncbi:amino acid adenylation domain-containing protein [Paenibacillus aurantiacus]|uniref:Amino acid adenylation domain-containing protein n=1 Tax=Paenibacillus aurantiacus TaxID=1936118 RepID=A0ABV5KXL5_9BACL
MRTVFEKERVYWSGRFAEEDALAALPYGKPATNRFIGACGENPAGAKLVRTIPRETGSRLAAIAKDSPAALYLLLLAGLQSLIYKYSHEETVILGVPRAVGQDRSSAESGLLIVKTKATGDSTLKTLLQASKLAVGEAMAHRGIPFREMAAGLTYRLDEGGRPVIPTLASLGGLHPPDSLDGFSCDLHFRFEQDEADLRILLLYNELHYEADQLDRMLGHLCHLFEAITRNPDRPLDDIETMPPAEIATMRCGWNDTDTAYESGLTIHLLFERQAERTPDETAVVFGAKRVSYRELNERANRLARTLRQAGAGPDRLVMVMAERGADMVAGLLAVLKAGAAYVPIDPEFPDARIRHMAEDSGSELLLAHRSLAGRISFGGASVFLDDPDAYASDGTNLDPLSGADNLAYVIYTSGSTGMPKGVMIEHRSVHNFFVGMTARIPFEPGGAILSVTTYSFDIFVLETLLPLTIGMTVAMADMEQQGDPSRLASWIASQNIRTAQMTPSRMGLLLADPRGREAIAGLRCILLGGEALPAALLGELRSVAQARIFNMYGPTETTVWSAVHEAIGDSDTRIGKPIANTQIYVLGPSGQLMPTGAAGELCIAGDGLARGYWRREELTAEKFAPHPFAIGERMYRTGDLARWKPDGTLECLGRLDQQVKIRGYRVEPGEIEAALLALDEVVEAAVVARADEDGAYSLYAYYASEREIPISLLRERLGSRLPAYMVPSGFVRLDRLPQTPNGKLDRKALPAIEAALPSSQTSAPLTPGQAQLADIWKEILRVPSVEATGNFFELGGHSLRAAALLQRIYEQTGATLAFRDVFDHPTLAAMAEAVSAASRTEGAIIPAAEPAEFYPSTSAQKRLYVLSRLDGAATSYNIPMALRINGPLERERLEYAFGELIRRHEALRTSFDTVQGELVQRIEPEARLVIEYSEASEEDARAQALAFVRPFDLRQAPLLRVGVIRLAPARHLLLIDVHHMVADGVSINLLVEEFTRLYAGEALAPLHIQYKDYAVWRHRLEQTEAYAAHERFWLDAFAGELPVLDLPTDFPRPALRRFEGDVIRVELGEALTARLTAFAAEQEATLYMVMLAAFSALLGRYGGAEDVVVGSPVAGRSSSQTQRVIGMFVNTLAMRSYPAPRKPFADYLREVRAMALGAYEHQHYPFEELVGRLRLARDFSRNPLFDAAFALQNMENPLPAWSGLQAEEYPLSHAVAKFDLALTAVPADGRIVCLLEYSRSLFKTETAERLAAHYANLLEAIIEAPERAIGSLNYMGEDETKRIVETFNATDTVYDGDRTIPSLFEERVRLDPEAVAVAGGGQQWTYRELNERANQLAALLQARGVGAETLVGVIVERSVDMIVGVLGILKAGGAYVPFEPQFPRERIEGIMSRSGIAHLVTQAEAFRPFEAFKWTLPQLRDIVLLDEEQPRVEREQVDAEQVKALWDYVARSAEGRVEEGGFVSSYTGEAFSEAEVDRYVRHVTGLIKPHLHARSRVLEIGCGSGLIMFELAGGVAAYVGMDPSPLTQRRNHERLAGGAYPAVSLVEGFAHETRGLADGSFDAIIIASAAQFFPGYRYLEAVIAECRRLLAPDGRIFIADVPDEERKETFRQSLAVFAREHQGAYRPTYNMDKLLYASRSFFDYAAKRAGGLQVEPAIERSAADFPNELQYRFDIVMRRTDSPADMPAPIVVSEWTRWHLEGYGTTDPECSSKADHLAYVIFTSGSTGTPKGVMVKHRPVINLIEWVNKTYGIGKGDRVLFMTSLCFDLSVYDIFGFLAAGASIRIASRSEIRNPNALAAMLRSEPVTFWDSAPAALQQLMPTLEAMGEKAAAASLRLVFLSGDWIPVTLPDRLRAAVPSARVIALGGATEATVWSNYYPVGDVQPYWASIPYGKPIQNARYYILNEALKPCPIGVKGALYIGGEVLASGYMHQPELTAERFIDNPFHAGKLYWTGDMARWLDDGNIEFMGRVDHQVKIRGYRIELGEIHAQLIKHEAVREAVVLDRPDPHGAKCICAYYVSASGLSPAELRAYASRWLPSYMLPSYFVPIDNIPLTANGKVDRAALPEPSAAAALAADYAEPRTDVERAMADVWAELLGLARIGIHDDFMALGGDSMKAIQAAAKLEERGYRVDIEHLFRYTRIAEASAYAQPIAAMRDVPAELPPLITVEPRYIEFLYCTEMEIVAVANWHGRGSAGMFADTWTFGYVSNASSRLGACLSELRRFDPLLLERYHGLALDDRTLTDVGLAVADILEQLRQGSPVLAAVKANAIPWDGGFGNPDNTRIHAATIIGVSGDGETFYCSDSWYGKFAQPLPKADLLAAYLNHAVMHKTRDAAELADWRSVVLTHAPRTEGGNSPFDQMRSFAQDVRAGLDLAVEWGDSGTWHDAPLIRTIFDLSTGRMMFAGLLRELAARDGVPALGGIADGLEEASNRWRSINKILVRASLNPAQGRHGELLAAKIEDIATFEEQLAIELRGIGEAQEAAVVQAGEAAASAEPEENAEHKLEPAEQCVYTSVPLGAYMNDQGFGSLGSDRANLTGMGTYFLPDEALASEEFQVDDRPFRFGDLLDGGNDNISCHGQIIRLPQGRYDEIALLGCSEWGNYIEPCTAVYQDGTKEVFRLRFTDWTGAPRFGERIAWEGRIAERNEVRTFVIDQPGRIFMQKHALDGRKATAALQLPYSPGMHIFAITLRHAPVETRPDEQSNRTEEMRA